MAAPAKYRRHRHADATEFEAAMRDWFVDGDVRAVPNQEVELVVAPSAHAHLHGLVHEFFAALRDADSRTVLELVAAQLPQAPLTRLARAEAALRNAVQASHALIDAEESDDSGAERAPRAAAAVTVRTNTPWWRPFIPWSRR